MSQVVIVGGGLSGLSAAHTVLENGGRVVIIDKNPFLGGNSTKATSGINGALTRTQRALGIHDSAEQFEKDTYTSAAAGQRDPTPYPLAKVLTHNSASAVEWLMDAFELDLSLVARLGGHSFPRTHRGKERFPGMTITYALMEKLEEIIASGDGRARLFTKARVTRLLSENGKVIGVEYEKDGQKFEEYGPVVLASGGYGADFSKDSLLQQHRPDLAHLPTTNGDHCTGDGIKMAVAVGADTIDMNRVQVHPTGLVHPEEPDAKVKFLAAEALRGVGGILLDCDGNRFCNELGRRDYVTGEMWKFKKGPYRLILNGKASKEIEWHCKHYKGRGLMKLFHNGADVAKEIGCSPSHLEETFKKYNEVAKNKNCPFGKKYFHNLPLDMNDDTFHVAVVTPVVHYTMGGLKISPDSEVENSNGPVPGLFAAGEVMGAVHGINRLGGSSLLDCVVFGRVSGNTASRYLLSNVLTTLGDPKNGKEIALGRIAQIAGHLSPVNVTVTVQPNSNVGLNINWGNGQPQVNANQAAPQQQQQAQSAPNAEEAPKAEEGPKEFTAEEVAKHNTKDDCWVIINGEVLNATPFLDDHPGGAKAILLYAGKDASEEFNMLHKPDVIEKYAPDIILGKLKQ